MKSSYLDPRGEVGPPRKAFRALVRAPGAVLTLATFVLAIASSALAWSAGGTPVPELDAGYVPGRLCFASPISQPGNFK